MTKKGNLELHLFLVMLDPSVPRKAALEIPARTALAALARPRRQSSNKGPEISLALTGV